jgi:hypothetical protein
VRGVLSGCGGAGFSGIFNEKKCIPKWIRKDRNFIGAKQ